jgi:NAD-dependent deacetylase
MEEDIKIIDRLASKLSRATRVAVLTGAGISAESGVPIFRGKGSMWENPRARELASRAGPPWNTKGTWEFYEWRRELVAKCNPNAAHLTIVEMEDFFENFCLITQNVDGLHLRAGSRRVLELHGNMWKGRCPKDGAIVDLAETPLKRLPPYHECGTALRPAVVQFGEPLDPEVLKNAFRASERAEMFLVIGTSGVVSPAAQLPLVALESGATVLEFNRESTVLTPYMTHSFRGLAAELLPWFWARIRSKCIRE